MNIEGVGGNEDARRAEVARAIRGLHTEISYLQTSQRSGERVLRDVYALVRQMRECGPAPMRVLETFPTEPGRTVMDLIAERGLGGPWYRRAGGDAHNFQLACAGTLICPRHTHLAECPPAAPRRGVVTVCRECGEPCVYRPCGRMLLVQCHDGTCTVTATRKHADGETYSN